MLTFVERKCLLTDFVEGFPELLQVLSRDLCHIVLHAACCTASLSAQVAWRKNTGLTYA